MSSSLVTREGLIALRDQGWRLWPTESRETSRVSPQAPQHVVTLRLVRGDPSCSDVARSLAYPITAPPVCVGSFVYSILCCICPTPPSENTADREFSRRNSNAQPPITTEPPLAESELGLHELAQGGASAFLHFSDLNHRFYRYAAPFQQIDNTIEVRAKANDIAQVFSPLLSAQEKPSSC